MGLVKTFYLSYIGMLFGRNGFLVLWLAT